MPAKTLDSHVAISLRDFMVNFRSESVLLQLKSLLLPPGMSDALLFSFQPSFEILTKVTFVTLGVLRLS